jgi:hypothetical protein
MVLLFNRSKGGFKFGKVEGTPEEAEVSVSDRIKATTAFFSRMDSFSSIGRMVKNGSPIMSGRISFVNLFPPA